MASVLPRRMADGRVSWRVQFRVGPAMRSKSFEHEAGARQFGQLIDRVGATAALAVWEARQSASAGTPTLREWLDVYLERSSGRLTGADHGLFSYGFADAVGTVAAWMTSGPSCGARQSPLSHR